MAFTCQQCGECCRPMGEIIELIEEFETFSFRIRFSVTGEERVVSIELEKRELFRIQDISNRSGSWHAHSCTKPVPKYVCYVHSSRPDHYPPYSCYRILVLDTKEKI